MIVGSVVGKILKLDIVVVVLDEGAQASRTQNTTVERETENDVAQGLSRKNSNNKKQYWWSES